MTTKIHFEIEHEKHTANYYYEIQKLETDKISQTTL